MRLPTLAPALLAATLAAAPAAAQYRLPEGDTLRYRERTETRRITQLAGGSAETRSLHEADLALAPAAGDTVRAFYEALRVELTGSGVEDETPPTGGILFAPYVLTVDARGRTRTVSAPALPSAIARVTDLSRQFDDLLLVLPEAPLAVGTAWGDTVEDGRPAPGVQRAERRAVRRYRVERDTVVDGVAALVIRVEQEVTLSVEAAVEDSPLTAALTARGTETGTALFDPAAGRLLRRTREGRLQGTYTLRGAGSPRDFPQIIAYTSTLELRVDEAPPGG